MQMPAHTHTRTRGRARSRISRRVQPARAHRTRAASLALGRRGHCHDLRTALKSRTPHRHTCPAPDGGRPAPRACSRGLLRRLTAKPRAVQGIELTSQQGVTGAGHAPTDGRAKRRRSWAWRQRPAVPRTARGATNDSVAGAPQAQETHTTSQSPASAVAFIGRPGSRWGPCLASPALAGRRRIVWVLSARRCRPELFVSRAC